MILTYDDRSPITHLSSDYVNVLSPIYATIVISRLNDVKDSVFKKLSSVKMIHKLNDLPFYEERYNRNDNPFLFDGVTSSDIKKLDDLVFSFNNRPIDYSLEDLESHFQELYFTVTGSLHKSS